MARGKKKQPNNPRKKPAQPKAKQGGTPAADPDVAKAHRAWERREFDRAITLYERALKRDPANAVLLIDTARACALRYRYVDAELLIERACRRYPDDARLQVMLGQSFEQVQQFDRAIACLERALELDPNSPQRPMVLLQLASMHERLHHLESARECAEAALQEKPQLEKAKFTLAIVERRSGQIDEAVARLRKIIAEAAAEPEMIARAWYELAGIHDKSQRYKEAFSALTEAKKILEKSSTPYRCDADKIAISGRRMTRSISPEHFQRWQSAGRRLPSQPGGIAFLTSHPRSGTTLLEQVLDSHPQLISADELQIFTDLVYMPMGRGIREDAPMPEVLDDIPLDMLTRLRTDYRTAVEGALREPIGERVLLDKNPEFTMMLPAISRAFPEMKIVFALRDPRDVVVSCFSQRLPLNAVSVHYLTLKGTIDKYATTMNAWLKLRDMISNPWMEVRYEDSVASLPQVSRRVLEFLELPWDDAVLNYRQRTQQKHVHSPTYEAVTKPVYSSSVGRWRNYADQLAPHLDQLQPFIEAFGYTD